MQVVTCFQCASQAQIAPDAYLCPFCGEDLQHLLLPETVVDFFQASAYALSERGELGAALAEAERGLTYVDNSELHLLAAILAKQLGRHDRMRQHVAAIPVDDSLRSEAEWLLRSHQDRERALQEAARQPRSQSPTPLPDLSTPGATFLEELLGGATPATAKNQRTHGQAIASVAIVVVAVILVAASWWWIGPGLLADNRWLGSELSSAEGPDAAPADSAVQLAAPRQALPTDTPVAQLVKEIPTAVMLPTATPTPAVPANLVQVAAQTPELADSNPKRAIVVETNIFDLKRYLNDQGYPELAALAIDARLQEDVLVLQGIVHLDIQRRNLLEITAAIPGVRDVNDVDLLLRPLPTYVVQEGDTLWSIVYNIYGDVEMLDKFAAYNQAILPSPDALAQGLELKVLPVQ
ncbi:MAG: hypothetical protein IT328_17400 [Caldilineaceae bacterium]|nr:hypothetical protein [Caldilineaceae bacterium]